MAIFGERSSFLFRFSPYHAPGSPALSHDMRSLKRLFRLVISTPGLVPNLLRKSDAAVVFMLHRFPDSAVGNPSAHDIESIRSSLAYLRRRGFELVPLATIFERADAREPLGGAIAFTIDDGYRDHAHVAAPLFAEFDCPVTTFLASGFLDGAVWFWWDQIEYVFHHAARPSVSVPLAGSSAPFVRSWSAPAERDAAQHDFITACKLLSEKNKQIAIAALAASAGVEIPKRAPDIYAPMSWADARACERTGMTFGPHTVSHPILSRTSDAQSRFEIEESWRRLVAELARPVPIFCYPNGQLGDYGERETNVLAAAGIRGAVVGTPGYAEGDALRDPHARFLSRRFSMPEQTGNLIQYVTGLERVKARVRGRRG